MKFIHKQHAMTSGNISRKQMDFEIALHKHCGVHPNIIQFYATGEDAVWRWIAMELAEGGDLFDKIGMLRSAISVRNKTTDIRLGLDYRGRCWGFRGHCTLLFYPTHCWCYVFTW